MVSKKVFIRSCGLAIMFLFFHGCGGSDGNNQDDKTKERPPEIEIPDTRIEQGPLKGKIAKWNKEIKGFIVAGDNAKAPALTEYRPKACTHGVAFRECHDNQTDFKKIFWANHSNLEDDQRDFKISDLLQKGFGVICGSLDVLNGKRVEEFKRQDEPIFFHPKVLKSAQTFYQLIHEDFGSRWNQFESGLLLGYSEVDAYSWSFGTTLAKKYYPDEKFTKSNDGYPEESSLSWRHTGKNRLKQILAAEEYRYVVAEYPPTNDPLFEKSF